MLLFEIDVMGPWKTLIRELSPAPAARPAMAESGGGSSKSEEGWLFFADS